MRVSYCSILARCKPLQRQADARDGSAKGKFVPSDYQTLMQQLHVLQPHAADEYGSTTVHMIDRTLTVTQYRHAAPDLQVYCHHHSGIWWPDELIELCRAMLHMEPQHRISADDALQLPFFYHDYSRTELNQPFNRPRCERYEHVMSCGQL